MWSGRGAFAQRCVAGFKRNSSSSPPPPPPRGSESSFASRASALFTKNKANLPKIAGGAVLAVVGGTLTARYWYSHHLKRDPSSIALKRDASQATVAIQTLPAAKPISQQTVDSVHLQHVPAEEFAQFVQQQQALLQQNAANNAKRSEQHLHAQLQEALQDAHERVTLFADWYFGYATTYKLLGKAVSSAIQHAVSFRDQRTLSEKVTHELQLYLAQKYQAIVLRPTLTDPRLHRAFVAALQTAHTDYLETIGNLDASVHTFVSNQAYTAPPSATQVTLTLDWNAQLQKVQHVPVQYEKFPERTVALVASGAAVGKVAGGAAMGATLQAVTAKLATPFATKAAATALSGKVAGGAASGAVLAGPVGGAVGAVAGAALGVGVDMGVNLGLSLLQRDAFERDIHESLDATLLEWEERLLPELLKVQKAWYRHAEAVLSNKSGDGNPT